MNNIEHYPVLTIVVLLATAFVVPVLYKKQKLITWLFLGAGAVSFWFALGTAARVMSTGTFASVLGSWPVPFGIELQVDALGAFTSLVFATLALPIFWHAAMTAKKEVGSVSGYFTLLLLLTAALHGIVLTGDIFNMFVFIEISSLAAVAIIAIKLTKESIEASFRYLVLSALGSGGILFAIALIFMITGHLNMEFIYETLLSTAGHYPLNVTTAIGFMLVGFGVKAALFPLHVWLPDAHSNAPTASSAILSGLVVKAYIVGFIRLVYLAFGTEIFLSLPLRPILLTMATAAILIGSLFALAQGDLKRLLAFSTVAQVGYIFLGFALFGERALQGAFLHILNHALMKGALFLSAGVIIQQTGAKKLSQISGLGRRLPITFGVFTIGVLSMIGIPGFAGFVSKLYLALGALDQDLVPFAIVILISSLLNAVYYLPIITNAFFGKDTELQGAADPPWPTRLPMLILGGGVVLLGLYPALALPLVRQAASLLFR